MRDGSVWEAMEFCNAAPGGSPTWTALPRWVHLVCEAGTLLGECPRTTPYVVALSLPFRSFAPAFLAASFAIERIVAGSFEARFKDGDLVATVRQRKREHVAELAVFHGYVEARQFESRGVRLQRFGREQPTTWWRSGGLRLVKYMGDKKKIPVGKPLVWDVTATDFASALLGPDEATWVGAHPLVGFLGDHPTVSADLSERLRLLRGSKFAHGSLADVLKEGNMKFASPRSVQSIESLEAWAPELVVFDDGGVFRKWGHRFRSSHHAVVLDRSAVTWEQDLEAIWTAYRQRQVSTNRIWPSTDGTGLEIVGFAA